jgi:multidrug efflux pump subunit AcrB
MNIFNLSAAAVKEKQLTLFFIILSTIAGLYAFSSLGRAEDPSFSVRIIVVSVMWPGAEPEEIQDQVVDRLEKRIQEVQNVLKIETTIRPGRADLQIEFEDFTSPELLNELFYQVRKRMQDEAPSLPSGVIGPIVNDEFSDVYFSLLAITGADYSPKQLVRLAEKTRDRLQLVEGVNKTRILGERPEKVFININTEKVLNMRLDLNAVQSALTQQIQMLPSGFIETSGPRVFLRLNYENDTVESIGNTPVTIDGAQIKLKDIADIVDGYEDPANYLIRANQQDAIIVGFILNEGVDGLAFGEQLEQFVKDERDRLPAGASMTIISNQSEAIAQAVELFQVKFLMALVVVMFVSIIAIGLRAGLIVGIAIPLTLGLTFLAMKMLNINLDRITLGALIIALGLLVDDAIIAIEMMIVKIEEGWSKVDAASYAWTVTASPMLFGTLVTIAGFVPVGFAQSSVGEYTGNIFWVLAFSLIISWLVAVTFTPYLGVAMLKENLSGGHSADHSPKWLGALRNLVNHVVNNKGIVVAFTFLSLGLSAFLMATYVPKQFFPSSDRLEVIVDVYMPQGSSIEATNTTIQSVERELESIKGIKHFSSYIGAGPPRFFLSSNPEQPDPAFGKVIAYAEDVKSRDKIISELQQRVDDGSFSEARVRISRLLFGPPVVWPIEFRVVGEDAEILKEAGREIKAALDMHPNTTLAHLEWEERVLSYQLDIDTARLDRFNLTPAMLASQLQSQFNGVEVSKLQRDIRTIGIMVKGETASVDVGSLEIKNLNGEVVKLDQLGKVLLVFEEPVIRRFNRFTELTVLADVVGAQAPDVTAEISKMLDPLRASLPNGYSIQIGGAVEQSVKANESIEVLLPVMVAFMLIFIMLQMREFVGTMIVLATAPLGLIGAAFALSLFYQPFGFVALLGLLGLAGILMRNTMILVQQVQDNLAEGMKQREAVVEAAVQRTRPVALTALAAVLAFIPLAFDSFWGPLAYVLIGGVSIGTIITILFVPALYALVYKIK